MKKTLFTVALFTMFFTNIVNAQANTNDPWLTRYWDGCKPSCSWGSNACKVCDINDNLIPNHSNQSGTSSCDGGAQFTCWDMIPWIDASNPNMAYGFVATPSRNQQCGTCWEITFTGTGRYSTTSQTRAIQGKKMTVMATNIGGDVADTQLDLLIPGGGLGLFDSFTRQTGISTSALGARYGGLLEDCERENNYNASTYKSCLTTKCNSVFSNANHARLREGCLFLANYLEAAGNPSFTRTQVSCPAELTRRYREATGSGGGTQPTNYTITYNANGGAGTAPAAQTVNIGSSVTVAAGTGLTRTGFTFGGWNTNAAGTETNHNAGASFTPTANTTLFARWNSVGGTTRTDTTKVEAESLTGALPNCIQNQWPQPMCRETSNGITAVGYISEGDAANYTVTVQQAGTYTVVLRAASEEQSSLTVTAGNSSTPAGTINVSTGGWNTYQNLTLSSTVQLNAGSNQIRLNFGGPMNVDYFLLITEVFIPTSVKFGAARASSTRSNIVLRPANKGFAALLPGNHEFESYSLVDLQGREIRRGAVQSGAAELYFDNIKQGAVFLRLKGKNGTTVLRTTTF